MYYTNRDYGINLIKARKSHCCYGMGLGIIILDDVYPGFPGDVRNASTYPYPIQYEIVEGVDIQALVFDEDKSSCLEPIKKAAKKLGLHEPKAPASLKNRIKSRFNNILGRPTPAADPLGGAIGYLRKSVDIRSPRGTNIVTIGAQSQSAKQAALIANTLAHTYIEYANQQLINQAQNAFGFMEVQADEALQKMRAAEQMFTRAVQISPDCVEAMRELRLINMRRDKSKGLIGRLFRR